MRILTLILTLLLTSCAVQMGKIPTIVKKLDSDEINYEELMNKKKNALKTKESNKDCMHVFVVVPNKLTLDMETVLNKSCPKSNYSFDNKLYDRFFYFLYGQECVVNEHHCENI